MDRASIIHNPAARNAVSFEALLAAAAPLRALGWEIDLRATEGPRHAVSLAKEAAAAGAKVVVASGGDGTVNEVINGIAGSESSLAIVRCGTGNVFAKEVGVPRDIARALRVLVVGQPYRFDLGIAGGRYFILMAGVGFDGSVVRNVPDRAKRMLGTTSYVLWGVAEALRFRSRDVSLRVDGEEESSQLYWLLLGNTRSYGGVINVTYRAIADDGLLDVYTFTGHGLPWVVSTGARILVRKQDGARGVSLRHVRDIDVLTPGLPVQADGEYFGETPMSFSVAPKALTVLLPPGGPRRILSAD